MTSALLGVLFLSASAGPGEVAKNWVDLMASAKVAEAAKLIGGPTKLDEKALGEMQRMMYTPRSPARKLEFGDPVAVAQEGDDAVAVIPRTWIVDPKQSAPMKKRYDSEMAEYFPADQLPAAKKVIRWDGDRFVNVVVVWLRREAGAWKVDPNGGRAMKLPPLRGQIRRKVGANLLRYANEDMGDRGCVDTKDPTGQCHSGENEPAITDAPQEVCVLPDGSPCTSDCYYTGGDDPVPCKKGQKDCLTFEGDPCMMK